MYLHHNVCISYEVGSWKMVVSDNCNTMFYFDGEYIREATSHRCLSPVNYEDYAEIYFTTTCTHAVMFQYDAEGSKLQFRDAPPTQSIHSFNNLDSPGTKMIVHRDLRNYAIVNKGKWWLTLPNDNSVHSVTRNNQIVTSSLSWWFHFQRTNKLKQQQQQNSEKHILHLRVIAQH